MDILSKINIALGKRPEWILRTLEAQNPDIDPSSGYEDVWFFGGVRNDLTVDQTFSLVSTSALDTAAGDGARTLLFDGVDTNGFGVEEIVTLNGTTPVQTVNTYRAFNYGEILTKGILGSNQGDISIYPTIDTSTSIQGYIAANSRNRTFLSHFHVPDNTNCLFMGFNSLEALDISDSVDFALVTKKNRDAPWIQKEGLFLRPNSVNLDVKIAPIFPLYIPPGAEMKIIAAAAVNNTQVNINYQILLERF